MKFTINYPFNREGVQWFCNDTIHEIFNALETADNSAINDFDFFITIGNREIVIPCDSEAYEMLTDTLKEIERKFNN